MAAPRLSILDYHPLRSAKKLRTWNPGPVQDHLIYYETRRLNAWSPTQLKSKCEAAAAAGGSAASGVEGPQAPGNFEDFTLGKCSKDASIMCHFN